MFSGEMTFVFSSPTYTTMPRNRVGLVTSGPGATEPQSAPASAFRLTRTLELFASFLFPLAFADFSLYPF